MGIPGSFEFRGPQEGHAQIAYRLKAKCRVKGKFKSDLRCYQFLAVADKLPPNTRIQSQEVSSSQVSHQGTECINVSFFCVIVNSLLIFFF